MNVERRDNIDLLLLAICVLLLLALKINCQEPPTLLKKTCDRTSTRMSRFTEAGFIPIVARNFDGSRIEWTFADDQGTFANILNVDKDTKLPAGFASNYKDHLFWAIYSNCDQHAYEIATMSPEQLKAFGKYNPK
jgi:hypothetical protein